LILLDKHATDISQLSTFTNQVRVCGKTRLKTRSRLCAMISLDKFFLFHFLFCILSVYLKVDGFHRDEYVYMTIAKPLALIFFLLNDHDDDDDDDYM